jgi:hypothetical protein
MIQIINERNAKGEYGKGIHIDCDDPAEALAELTCIIRGVYKCLIKNTDENHVKMCLAQVLNLAFDDNAVRFDKEEERRN